MGCSDLKKGYQPRTNVAKDVQGDLVGNSLPQYFG